MKVKLGCDPEEFVVNTASGKFVSAHGLVEGTKEKPFPVDCGAVQVDGMALEFNTTPVEVDVENPSDGVRSFVSNVNMVQGTLGKMIADRGLVLVAEPVAHFDKEVWDNTPEEAKELGCDPDFNAYTGVRNESPNGKVDFRTAAGHLHIGWTEGADEMSQEHFETCRNIVRNLDSTLGVLSIVFDENKERRELYGKAGAFRPKSYGVEHRVMSNFWLKEEILKSIVAKMACFTLWGMFNKKQPVRTPEQVQDIINNSKKDEAVAVIKELLQDDYMKANLSANEYEFLEASL